MGRALCRIDVPAPLGGELRREERWRSDGILMSGMGIAGRTLVYWLLEHGLTPTLVEQAPSLCSGGYVIDFWGFDVAERMGLVPARV